MDQGSNNIVYDYGDDSDIPDELPNADDILNTVLLILEYMNSTSMIAIKKSNPVEFEKMIEDKFPDFTTRYYGIFRMLLSGDDISPLFAMLQTINNINSGDISFEKGEKDVGKYLKKFLPEDLVKQM